MTSPQPEQPRRPAITLESLEASRLTEQTTRLAELAQRLFDRVVGYEQLVHIGDGLDRRVGVVDGLLGEMEASCATNQPGARVLAGSISGIAGARFSGMPLSTRESPERRLKFFKDLREGLVRDKNNHAAFSEQTRRSIKLELKKVLHEVDLYINSPYPGSHSLNAHPQWRMLGTVYAQLSGMLKTGAALDTEKLAGAALQLTRLAFAVETDFDLSCSRVTQEYGDPRGCIEFTTRCGWRLGTPLARGAMAVRLHEEGTQELLLFPRDTGQGEFSDETWDPWRDGEAADAMRSGQRAGDPLLGRALIATRELTIPWNKGRESIEVELGRLVYHRFGDVFEIHALHVDESVRGASIGTQLMNALLHHVATRPQPCTLFVDVPTGSHPGSTYRHAGMDRLLNSFGFRIVPGASGGFVRMQWEREFAAPLLGS